MKNSSNEIEFILVDTQNNLNINTTEGDVTLSKGDSLNDVIIDNVNRVVELKGASIAKTAVKTGAAGANGRDCPGHRRRRPGRA